MAEGVTSDNGEKLPWLPLSLQEGAVRERCPRCHRLALTPWILRRDRERRVWRRWLCIECQFTEERLEDESG
jgi:hypothetical protein